MHGCGKGRRQKREKDKWMGGESKKNALHASMQFSEINTKNKWDKQREKEDSES